MAVGACVESGDMGSVKGEGQPPQWPWEKSTHPAVFSAIARGGVAAEWNLRASWAAGRSLHMICCIFLRDCYDTSPMDNF